MTQCTSRTVLIIAGIVLGISGCSERMGKGWDWNRMRNQPRYQPYRDSKFFADGKAMQLPPAGTVSRESIAADSAPPPDSALVATRGKSQYGIYCAVCHGVRGDGNSIVATNMAQPSPPPSLIVPPVSLMSASIVATVIANGFGTRMPSFKADLSAADRQAVAEYVKTLQNRDLPVAATPPHQ